MRQLFPIFQTTAPEGTAQALPLYWDVDMDYDKGVPRFSGGEPVLASGLEAVKGWAWRALHTERYRWSPFSWDYGGPALPGGHPAERGGTVCAGGADRLPLHHRGRG